MLIYLAALNVILRQFENAGKRGRKKNIVKYFERGKHCETWCPIVKLLPHGQISHAVDRVVQCVRIIQPPPLENMHSKPPFHPVNGRRKKHGMPLLHNEVQDATSTL